MKHRGFRSLIRRERLAAETLQKIADGYPFDEAPGLGLLILSGCVRFHGKDDEGAQLVEITDKGYAALERINKIERERESQAEGRDA